MQVVRHQTVAEQNPIVAVFGPNKRINDHLSKTFIIERGAMMARTDGEMIGKLGGVIKPHGKAVTLSDRMLPLNPHHTFFQVGNGTEAVPYRLNRFP
jgi:hypothetical protein